MRVWRFFCSKNICWCQSKTFIYSYVHQKQRKWQGNKVYPDNITVAASPIFGEIIVGIGFSGVGMPFSIWWIYYVEHEQRVPLTQPELRRTILAWNLMDPIEGRRGHLEPPLSKIFPPFFAGCQAKGGGEQLFEPLVSLRYVSPLSLLSLPACCPA